MTLSRAHAARLDARMARLKEAGEPFAMATIVRTLDATSAKPGGKALVSADGTILEGWIGGGCARGAVARAAREAIATGAPQFLSLRPQDLLDRSGVAAGERRDGISYARNGCPSRGTMDIFVEPVLPLPRLVIHGAGPVALALADLAVRFDLHRTLVVPDPGAVEPDSADRVVASADGFRPDFLVIATQGQGDLPALQAAVAADAPFIAFVGSARKFATLAERLRGEDPALAPALARVAAPAGLPINAITPEEIALSILAQITLARRARDRFNDQERTT